MYRTTLAFCFLAFSRTIFAQSDAISELDHLLQGVETLSADITQLIIQSDGGVLEESDIRLRVKRPNGFYWETVSPFPELLVTNGKRYGIISLTSNKWLLRIGIQTNLN